MIRDKLTARIETALLAAKDAGELSFEELPEIALEPPKNKAFGDFTTNVAMALAGETKRSARDVAVKV
ncbi:MAG: arginine--tRNA ligase, partial [Armatimonadetes bacterium]|nr:arginine--tRNA ligase [Armatimonadota bacterium]